MGVNCPYCTRPAELVDSSHIYGIGRQDYGKFWSCDSCDAYVGTHKNSKQHKPLGTLANPELRLMRQKAHAAFDPLWQTKMKIYGSSKGRARKQMYGWLADRLGIPVASTHIAQFDYEQCRLVIAVCDAHAYNMPGFKDALKRVTT